MLKLAIAGIATMVMLTSPAFTGSWGRSTDREWTIDDLKWMTGSWVSETANRQRTSEEHWTWPAGGSMFGCNRLIVDDRLAFFEYLRIETTEDGLVYFASPKGRSPATPFRLTELEDHRAVFENPGHDFPKVVMYSRKGNVLTAQAAAGERQETWRWSLHGAAAGEESD